MAGGPAADVLAELALVDAHCHSVLRHAVGAAEFERCCTEADALAAGTSGWDSPAGLAIRRWCPPALDLPAFASPEAYLERRAAFGPAEVTSRLLRAAGLSHLLVDTGLGGGELVDLPALGLAVRLERVAEELATDGVTAAAFADAYLERLHAACAGAVAVKSVVAYRHGLDVEPDRPGRVEVRTAAAAWLGRQPARLDHPVLLRFLLWAAVDLGLPLQIHAGFGDRDLAVARSDPALLQPFLAAVEPVGVTVVLLHCYPYHRQAGWLATVYPHVHVDVGLTVGQTGAGAERVLGEILELAPFAKILFSTDGYRLPELYLVGAAQFRDSFGRLLDGRVRDGDVSVGDAVRVARLVGGDNARRVYGRLGRGGG